MSTDLDTNLIPTPPPAPWFRGMDLAQLAESDSLIHLINRTRSLTDEAFEDAVHNIGFRVALWTMRKGAIAGDVATVKACEVYLKRCDVARERQRKPTPSADERSVSVTAELLPKPRQTPQEQ